MCQPMSEISIGISNIQGKRSVSHYFFRGALVIVTLSYRKNSFDREKKIVISYGPEPLGLQKGFGLL